MEDKVEDHVTQSDDEVGRLSKDKKRHHAYCFTMNSTWDQEPIKRALEGEKIEYMVMGNELGSKNGRQHIQGYIRFKGAKTWSGVRKLYAFHWLMPAAGSDEQNRRYCTKDGRDIFEIGTMKDQGKRSDLEKLKAAILEEGLSLTEVVRSEHTKSYQALKFAESLEKYRGLSKRTRDVVVNWVWGSSGSGKTSYCMSQVDDDYWISGRDLQWFEYYHGQKHVIFDDFRGSQVTFTYFLRLLDRYSLFVPVKGGSVLWVPEVIWVTSINPPEKCWHITELGGEPLEQLLRRISHVYFMSGGVCTEVAGNNRRQLPQTFDDA